MSIKQFFSFEGAFVCLGLIIFSVGCNLQTTHRPIPTGANQDLVAHSKIFRKGIEMLTENVHVAIGYGISNCVMIEGNDGVIIVDTMTTREEAIEVLAEFRKISSKPVRAIIYNLYAFPSRHIALLSAVKQRFLFTDHEFSRASKDSI
jgi:hypothetical protein